MNTKRIYETLYVLSPDLSEGEAEASLQSTVELLKTNGSDIIGTEFGGKRRLAYAIQKQRYGYYNLIHYHGTPTALVELERMFRLSDRVLRYLTVRFDKEQQLTGLTRQGDDDVHDDDRDDRLRGSRRGDFGRRRHGRDRDIAPRQTVKAAGADATASVHITSQSGGTLPGGRSGVDPNNPSGPKDPRESSDKPNDDTED